MNSIRMWALFAVLVLLLWGIVVLITSNWRCIDHVSIHEYRLHSRLPRCPLVPPSSSEHFRTYDPVEHNYTADLSDVSWDTVIDANPQLLRGGEYRPESCEPTSRVAILIPYRNREQHLRVFLLNMHRLLRLQQISYTIFVVHQTDAHPFNRGMLFNVGVMEALKLGSYDCFILHDVDLIPENGRQLYTCPSWPLHMAASIEKFKYELPGQAYVGGVLALPKAVMLAVNGHSNMFWGWGAEDDDMFFRLTDAGFGILRSPPQIGRYWAQKHDQAEANPDAYVILEDPSHRKHTEGLNTTHYEVMDIVFHHLYTSIDVRLPRTEETNYNVSATSSSPSSSTTTPYRTETTT